MDTPLPPEAGPAVSPAPTVRPPWPGRTLGHLLAVCVALVGCLLGIMGAFIEESRVGGFLLLPFLGAPIIEEGLKPAGLYILLIRWPHLLRNQLYTAALAALAGLAFGVIEAIVYVKVYVSNPSEAFVIYRFTVPLLLHTAGSFLVGLGINRPLLNWAQGEAPLPRASRNLFFLAVTIHAIFNITAFALSIAGLFDVD